MVGIVLTVLAPAAAWADGTPPPTTSPPQTTPGYPTPGYPSPQTANCTYPYPNPQICTSSAGSSSPSGSSGSLPFTGGDVALMSVIGAVVVAGGVALVVVSRRRRTVTT